MNKKEQQPALEFAFGKKNYFVLLAGILVVIFGYILMSGGGSEDPTKFSEAIFSVRRITIAPLVVLAGYGTVMYSIFVKNTSSKA